MTVHDMEQRSEEWFAARLGKVTASRISDVIARTKSGWGAGRKNYAAELVAERLTGAPAHKMLSTPEIRWGNETEPDARAAYEFYRGIEVVEVGFVDHPSLPMSGASPDGLVGDDGLIEIKCPNTSTHIDTLMGGSIPDKYLVQMLWQMACAGRQWCDFASFDPRMPEDMRLHVIRVQRDDARIAELEKDVALFLGEVEQTVAELRKRYEQPEAA